MYDRADDDGDPCCETGLIYNSRAQRPTHRPLGGGWFIPVFNTGYLYGYLRWQIRECCCNRSPVNAIAKTVESPTLFSQSFVRSRAWSSTSKIIVRHLEGSKNADGLHAFDPVCYSTFACTQTSGKRRIFDAAMYSVLSRHPKLYAGNKIKWKHNVDRSVSRGGAGIRREYYIIPSSSDAE